MYTGSHGVFARQDNSFPGLWPGPGPLQHTVGGVKQMLIDIQLPDKDALGVHNSNDVGAGIRDIQL